MPGQTMSSGPFLRVARLTPTATLPLRGSAYAAGYDLFASEPLVIKARGRGVVKTGIKIAIPLDTYARVAPRSGLAVKMGIDCGAGVIDSDYRGEVMVALFNHNDTDFNVKVGDRVAQLILERIHTPVVEDCTDDGLDDTDRGSNGFGSTGGF